MPNQIQISLPHGAARHGPLAISRAAFSGDGRRIATIFGYRWGARDALPRVWDVASGDEVVVIPRIAPAVSADAAPDDGPRPGVQSVALDHGGERALVFVSDGAARLFDIATRQYVRVLHRPGMASRDRHSGGVVAIAPDGRLLVGYGDGTVAVWDPAGDSLLHLLQPYGDDGPEQPATRWSGGSPVSSLSLSADGRYLLVETSDETVSLWDLKSGTRQFQMGAYLRPIVALWERKSVVRWASAEGVVWEVEPGGAPTRLLTTGEAWREAVFSPGGEALLVRLHDGKFKRWSVSGQQELLSEIVPDGRWDPDARLLGFSTTGDVYFYPDAPHRSALRTPYGRAVLERPDAPPLTSGTQGATQDEMARFDRNRAEQALLSPRGDLAVTAKGYSPEVELWSIPSGRFLGTLVHDHATFALELSPSGDLLAVSVWHHAPAEGSHDVYVWDVVTRQLRTRLRGHTERVTSVAFGPDERWVVTAAQDGSVRLWTLGGASSETTAEVATRQFSDLDHSSLNVLRDGRILVYRHRHVDVWQGLTERRLEIATGSTRWRRWRISADQRYLLRTGDGQTVDLWDLHDGSHHATYGSLIARPEWSTTDADAQLDPANATRLWRLPGGPYLQGPKALGALVRDPRGRPLLVRPAETGGVELLDVTGEPRLLRHLPLEGNPVGSAAVGDRLLLLSATGELVSFPLDG